MRCGRLQLEALWLEICTCCKDWITLLPKADSTRGLEPFLSLLFPPISKAPIYVYSLSTSVEYVIRYHKACKKTYLLIVSTIYSFPPFRVEEIRPLLARIFLAMYIQSEAQSPYLWQFWQGIAHLIRYLPPITHWGILIDNNLHWKSHSHQTSTLLRKLPHFYS